MLMPKRVKNRKQLRGKLKGHALQRQQSYLRRIRYYGYGAYLDYLQPD